LIEVRSHGPDGARDLLVPGLRDLFGEVYAEPPYYDGPEEVAEFVAGFEQRLRRPGFRLITAHDLDQMIGFLYGHTLPADTIWWKGLLTPASPDLTAEWDTRTVVIIDFVVRATYRRRGIGRSMHSMFLAERTEERATLLVRPQAEAAPAQAAYASWGYRRIGRLRPLPDAPEYDALVLDLKHRPAVRSSPSDGRQR
jgi:ribosomal protein S18 acetylase RimI-like enzyme